MLKPMFFAISLVGAGFVTVQVMDSTQIEKSSEDRSGSEMETQLSGKGKNRGLSDSVTKNPTSYVADSSSVADKSDPNYLSIIGIYLPELESLRPADRTSEIKRLSDYITEMEAYDRLNRDEVTLAERKEWEELFRRLAALRNALAQEELKQIKSELEEYASEHKERLAMTKKLFQETREEYEELQ